ncbi:hypothetical protein ACIGKL_16655 [Pseudomonas sp. NPDC077186]|uniref:hypothetical protein n=1 Tax=Pseudomonas sp. NPDC077186 TaxID=3364421 RepID=UPI0037CCB604
MIIRSLTNFLDLAANMPRSVKLEIPAHLVESAQLYAPTRHELDAVCYVLERFPDVVADLRRLTARVAQLDAESAQLDQLVAELQAIARRVLDL